jgi:hypothetical protein
MGFTFSSNLGTCQNLSRKFNPQRRSGCNAILSSLILGTSTQAG